MLANQYLREVTMKIIDNISPIFEKIKPESHLFIQGAAATPHELVKGLMDNIESLRGVILYHMHTHGPADYADPKYRKNIRVKNLFVGGNIRKYVDYDFIDYIPCFLSEVPALLRNGKQKIDTAFIQVSPPDEHGYCSLGTSVDVTLAALEAASLVVAVVNKQMPRVHGDGIIHHTKIDFGIEVDRPIDLMEIANPTSDELKIGAYCASIIEDGSCLQTGIGRIPNAVLASLKNHKNLGIHSEMWSDGVLDLIECGAVNNSNKTVHPNKCVSSFMMGTQRMYDYVHDNPSVIQIGMDYVNSPTIIARNEKVVAINSAVEIDMTGQVCADSIGHQIISGVGGQVDFIRGASLSKGGKPIIAVLSRTKSGKPKIVPYLQEGAGVVTSRYHTHYVVTEFGIADLHGKTLGERAKALVQIAHPDDREDLSRTWFDKHRKY